MTPLLNERAPWAALCLTLTLLWSSAALGQGSPEVTEERSIEAMTRRATLTPKFNAALGFSKHTRVDGEERPGEHLILSGGLALNLTGLETLIPYIALNMEMEHNAFEQHRSTTYFMPTMHAGLSVAGCHEGGPVTSAMFPCFQMYAIGGVRPGARTGQPAAVRFGLGLNSIYLPALAIQGSMFLPSSYEFIVETDPLGNTAVMGRFGIGF